MLKIIKYLNYNKNKSKKNYIKCTKFKVSTNFMTNFYLLGIQKVLDPDVRRSDRSQGPRFQKVKSQVRQEVRETAIPEGQVRQVMKKDRDLFSPTRCPT
jgi:hypothetical protein